MKIKIILLSLSAVILFSSCSLIKNVNQQPFYKSRIHELSRKLNESLLIPSLKNRETGVMTFVKLGDFDKTENIGRYVQQSLMHSLFEQGFRLVEIRSGAKIETLKKNGEFNLTRIREKLRKRDLGSIRSLILGTYSEAGDYIYIEAKLIELENSLVRAAGEIYIKKDSDFYNMMKLTEKPKKKKKPLKDKQDNRLFHERRVIADF